VLSNPDTYNVYQAAYRALAISSSEVIERKIWFIGWDTNCPSDLLIGEERTFTLRFTMAGAGEPLIIPPGTTALTIFFEPTLGLQLNGERRRWCPRRAARS